MSFTINVLLNPSILIFCIDNKYWQNFGNSIFLIYCLIVLSIIDTYPLFYAVIAINLLFNSYIYPVDSSELYYSNLFSPTVYLFFLDLTISIKYSPLLVHTAYSLLFWVFFIS
jgi:hypothetical protein